MNKHKRSVFLSHSKILNIFLGKCTTKEAQKEVSCLFTLWTSFSTKIKSFSNVRVSLDLKYQLDMIFRKKLTLLKIKFKIECSWNDLEMDEIDQIFHKLLPLISDYLKSNGITGQNVDVQKKGDDRSNVSRTYIDHMQNLMAQYNEQPVSGEYTPPPVCVKISMKTNLINMEWSSFDLFPISRYLVFLDELKFIQSMAMELKRYLHMPKEFTHYVEVFLMNLRSFIKAQELQPDLLKLDHVVPMGVVSGPLANQDPFEPSTLNLSKSLTKDADQVCHSSRVFPGVPNEHAYFECIELKKIASANSQELIQSLLSNQYKIDDLIQSIKSIADTKFLSFSTTSIHLCEEQFSVYYHGKWSTHNVPLFYKKHLSQTKTYVLDPFAIRMYILRQLFPGKNDKELHSENLQTHITAILKKFFDSEQNKEIDMVDFFIVT